MSDTTKGWLLKVVSGALMSIGLDLPFWQFVAFVAGLACFMASEEYR